MSATAPVICVLSRVNNTTVANAMPSPEAASIILPCISPDSMKVVSEEFLASNETNTRAKKICESTKLFFIRVGFAPLTQTPFINVSLKINHDFRITQH